MQRGNHIFTTLFESPATLIVTDRVKGRDATLIEKRNERLLYRYFYYGFYTDKKLSSVYSILSEQFDLTERRIHDIISESLDALQQIRKEQPSIKELRSKFPFLVWD